MLYKCNSNKTRPRAYLWWRIELVEAHLEGLSFSVPICAVTKVCHLCTSTDYFNRNTLLSSNWYLENIWIIIPWEYFSCMLMDYVDLYANIIYYHHMLVYLGCWGQVAGIKIWAVCSMVVFIERLDEVGS